jgi:hypothetical protein
MRPSRARRSGAAAAILLASGLVPVEAADLSLPPDAGAPPGGSAVVPLSISDAGGLLGTDIVVTYDPAVALATSVAATALSSSHALTVNLSPPGQIRVSLYGSSPLGGGGVLLEITFQSVGPDGSETALRLAAADLNEGAIPAVLGDGRYCVRARPAEAQNLRLSRAPGSTVATLSWDPHPVAASFNVYRGERADLGDLACFLAGVTTVPAPDDGALPPLGRQYVYLVTAVSCGGESTLGFASSGERTNPAPCP